MTAAIDTLIGALSADLRPVRRLRPPIARAAGWTGLVVAAALVLATDADLRQIAARLAAAPDMWLAVVGSSLTTLLAAVATFELSVPDRRPAWAYLPLPGVALWFAASGLGCLRTWIVPGLSSASLADSRDCFTFILELSIPLSVAMILMIRRAFPLRPGLTAATAGLAVAAGAATLLDVFHPSDANATDVVVHVVAVGLVILVNRAVGGRLLAHASRPPPRP